MEPLDLKRNSLPGIQGHPTQIVFFETALKDSSMQVRFDLMSVLECWDHEFLAHGTNSHSVPSIGPDVRKTLHTLFWP